MESNYKINTTKSKSGKRTLFFATINEKRISRTNFSKKWESEKDAKSFIEFHGSEKINKHFYS